MANYANNDDFAAVAAAADARWDRYLAAYRARKETRDRTLDADRRDRERRDRKETNDATTVAYATDGAYAPGDPVAVRADLTWDGYLNSRIVPLTPDEEEGPVSEDGTFEEKVDLLFGEARDLLLSKHRMYGATNISQSPGGPLNGLRVRIWDKVARLNNIIDRDLRGKEEHESLEDTFIDLLNYSAIAVMALRGDWPSE